LQARSEFAEEIFLDVVPLLLRSFYRRPRVFANRFREQFQLLVQNPLLVRLAQRRELRRELANRTIDLRVVTIDLFLLFLRNTPKIPVLRLQPVGDLFGEEPVPWLIVVDGLDHIVAITPHAFGELGFGGVEILSRGVYIAGGVEPQPSPSLAVPRRRQQAVEQTLIG